MGRPSRKDADYFPFFCKEGKTFTILRNRFALEGIGFFTELCIILTTTPDHHIQLQDEVDYEYFVARVRCEKDKVSKIINTLAMTGKIHKELWEKAKVIVIPDLLSSLKDAYVQRTNTIIKLEEIVSMYITGENRDENPLNMDGNPAGGGGEESFHADQSLKETKLKETKVKESRKEREEPPSESQPAPAKNRFIPPDVKEVREYCKERGNSIDAEFFVAHYTANGWVQSNRKPIRDWKACVITWEKREREFSSRATETERRKQEALKFVRERAACTQP